MNMSPTDLFTLLSDETRLRCMVLLHAKKTLCVCEFCEILQCIQPKISRHLGLLRKTGLVVDERKGQWVYYSLNPKLPKWIQAIHLSQFNILKEIEPFKSDIKKASCVKSSCC